MIYQKGNMWKISGRPEKYSSLSEAEVALAKLNRYTESLNKKQAEDEEKAKVIVQKNEEERLSKLKFLAEDSTPYEKMIAKNICKICNLEPCECFTYTERMDLGE